VFISFSFFNVPQIRNERNGFESNICEDIVAHVMMWMTVRSWMWKE
jgi:hypothetical protein